MTTKTTNTPGPWHYKSMGPKYGGWSIGFTRHVAEGKSCDALTGRDLPAHDVDERIARVMANCYNDGSANARLIAAAPDLLAAAKMAAHALAEYDEPAILRDVRAAIAKATGDKAEGVQ